MDIAPSRKTIAISNRGLLLTCTTISILSFFGILFLVVVTAILVSKAVQLAINYAKFQNAVRTGATNFATSDQYKNFQDHLIDASQRALHSTQKVLKKETPVMEEEEARHPMNLNLNLGPDPYNY